MHGQANNVFVLNFDGYEKAQSMENADRGLSERHWNMSVPIRQQLQLAKTNSRRLCPNGTRELSRLAIILVVRHICRLQSPTKSSSSRRLPIVKA
jgi:hypothetical protein